jgi:hypothetical protein
MKSDARNPKQRSQDATEETEREEVGSRSSRKYSIPQHPMKVAVSVVSGWFFGELFISVFRMRAAFLRGSVHALGGRLGLGMTNPE